MDILVQLFVFRSLLGKTVDDFCVANGVSDAVPVLAGVLLVFEWTF